MKYIGNCKEHISFNLLQKIKNTSGDVRPKIEEFDQNYKSDTLQKWIACGYDLKKIRWSLYYSEHLMEDFSPNKILKNITNWWFVKLNPGDIFPYHKDLFENQQQVNRYWVACEDYKPGHIFSYDKSVLTGYQAGDIFLFDAKNIYHGAANIGFEPKISLQICTTKEEE